VAVLTTQERAQAVRRLARRMYDEQSQTANLDLIQIVAAIAGIDDFLESQMSAINQAIPQPARGVMTVPQKAELLAYVALKKTGAI